jgi:FkbM family methyltransferase
MLLPVSELSKNWGISPNGVLHVGAHIGEEAQDYEAFDWLPVIWIEANPNLVDVLKRELDSINHKVILAAAWHIDNLSLKLNVASNSMSSSLLDFGSHLASYPEIKFIDEIGILTKRLDSILQNSEVPNLLNLDIQGAELNAIRGLGKLISRIDYIIVEVNKVEVYKECTLVPELDRYLSLEGFKRMNTRWFLGKGWGDALYIRNDKIPQRNLLQRIRSMRSDAMFYLKQIPGCLIHPKLLKYIRIIRSNLFGSNQRNRKLD